MGFIGFSVWGFVALGEGLKTENMAYELSEVTRSQNSRVPGFRGLGFRVQVCTFKISQYSLQEP